jgi:4-hydroxy-tetrahydrodipicolinate synthase
MFREKFGVLITAMVTPFNEDLSIDYKSLEKIIDHLIQSGSTSILITGTTGENPTLTHEEEWELLKRTKEITQAITKAQVPILFGAGSNCTRTAIEVSKKAEELGADGILSVSPYYNKPNQEGIFAHFAEIAKGVNLPIVLYNNPGRTCSSIEPETVYELNKNYPNIVAVKESSGSLDNFTWLSLKAPNIEIYCGDDNLILPSIAIGSQGAISVTSHIAGTEIRNIIDLVGNDKVKEAAKIHSKLFPLFKAAFSSPSPGPIKYALSQLGLCKPYLRLPLTEPATSVRDSLRQILTDLNLNSFSGLKSLV